MPLPTWFVEIDTAKKGEVSRADFLKYRMKSFDELDTNKDGKVSLEEFLKLAEPPYLQRRAGRAERSRSVAIASASAFQNARHSIVHGFIERAEAEALIQRRVQPVRHDRDNKITEPEIRADHAALGCSARQPSGSRWRRSAARG